MKIVVKFGVSEKLYSDMLKAATELKYCLDNCVMPEFLLTRDIEIVDNPALVNSFCVSILREAQAKHCFWWSRTIDDFIYDIEHCKLFDDVNTKEVSFELDTDSICDCMTIRYYASHHTNAVKFMRETLEENTRFTQSNLNSVKI